MANNWQSIFNQLNSFQPTTPTIPSSNFYAPMPVTPNTFTSTPQPNPNTPNSGGIGDTLAGFGKDLWNGTLNDLGYLDKAARTAETAVTDPLLYLKNMITGKPTPNVYSDISNIWTNPSETGDQLASNNANQLFGWNPANHSDFVNGAFSPGSWANAATDVFAPTGGVGKVAGTVVKGLMDASRLNAAKSIYRQAAEEAAGVPKQPAEDWMTQAALEPNIGSAPPSSLNRVMRVNPSPVDSTIPPMQNGKQLADWLEQNQGKAGMGDLFAPGELQGMTKTPQGYQDLKTWTDQLFPDLAKTAPYGVNPDELLKGDLTHANIQANPDSVISKSSLPQDLLKTPFNGAAQSLDEVLKVPNHLLDPKLDALNPTAGSLDMPESLMSAKVGDEVTPISGDGTMLTPKPAKVVDIQTAPDGTKYYRVEGTNTYFPESQIKTTNNLVDELVNGKPKFNPTQTALDANVKPELENLDSLFHTPKEQPLDSNYPDFIDSAKLPPSEMPSAEDVYKNVPLQDMLTPKALSDAQKPQWLQRIQDAMARWGIMGSGLETKSMKDSGMSDVIKNGLAGRNNDISTLKDWGVDLASKVKTPADRDALQKAMHDYESGAYTQGSNKVFDELAHALQHGAAGTNSGLTMEQAYNVAAKELRENYFPITMDVENMPKDLKNMLAEQYKNDGMKLDRRSLDQRYTLDREFPSNLVAKEKGFAVHDPITSAVMRLQKSAHDVNMAKMYSAIRDHGYQNGWVSDKPGANLVKYMSKDGAPNPLNGKYIHKDLAGTLNTMFDRTPWSHANIPVISPALQNWDKMTHFYRNATLYTPMVHLHNIFGNALMAAGTNPADYLAAEKAMKSGDSLAYQMAKKTGALGEDFGQGAADAIKKAYGETPTGLKGLKDKYNNFQQSALWDREKALRLSVFTKYFDEAVGRGLKTADAANVARDATLRHMIDYSNNNLSTFEKEVMSRIDPFYRWHRGNYSLQLSKMASDPAFIRRVAQVQEMENNAQENATGHDMNSNIGGNNGKLQVPMDDKGNFMEYDPYLPFGEVGKLLSQNPANTAFNRLNPFLREGMNQATNNQFYPMQAVTPTGKDYMTGQNYAIRNPATNAGQQIIDTLKHGASETILPTDQAIPSAVRAAYQGIAGQPQGKYAEVPAVAQLIADLTGGFLGSTPTSQSKVNAQIKKEKGWLKEFEKAAKKRGN